jgi:hypothetical protein
MVVITGVIVDLISASFIPNLMKVNYIQYAFILEV